MKHIAAMLRALGFLGPRAEEFDIGPIDKMPTFGVFPENATDKEVLEMMNELWPVDRYQDLELDHYVWAWSPRHPTIGDDAGYTPHNVCSPHFVGVTLMDDFEAARAAAEYRAAHPEIEGAYLWAHLGRGWMLLGQKGEQIPVMGPTMPVRTALREFGV